MGHFPKTVDGYNVAEALQRLDLYYPRETLCWRLAISFFKALPKLRPGD